MITHEFRHFHFCCGLGGGKKGFNKSVPRVGNMVGKWRCIGGIDNDAAAINDFNRAGLGNPGTVMDLFTLEQYVAFHGKLPPSGWKEATPADIRRAAGGERPHAVFISSPCKGASGLLSEKLSLTAKYQALNALTLRCVWLMCEAWPDDPPELIVFENVPRLATRGRALLDQINQVLHTYGYASAETAHDCGVIGGLAQSRKRFLLVARHLEKVPPFLYEPDQKRLRGVGEVLGRMPLPGDLRNGPMHRIPRLQWKTWVRLAFVEAGSDWRSLNKLVVENNHLRDYLIVPCGQEGSGPYGVNRWTDPTGVVAGRSLPTNGNFSVADPRFDQSGKWNDGQAYGVRDWDQTSGTIAGQQNPGQGTYSVADPRMPEKANRQNGFYRVIHWDRQSGSVTGAAHVAGAAMSVGDPRTGFNDAHKNVFRIIPWTEHAGAVTSGHGPSSGGGCVSDPRVNWNAGAHQAKLHVTDWQDPQSAVTGARGPYSGACAVADPRAHAGFEGEGKYQVTPFDSSASVVIAASTTGHGAFAVADPRTGKSSHSGFGVTGWEAPAGTVAGESLPSNGGFAVADPRSGINRGKGDNYLTGGHYGVLNWDASSGAVSAAACHDNGPWSVADPRLAALPALDEKTVAIIRSIDGTWHRPFTTLELAALQSLIEPEEYFELDGLSDSAWRERIGNAVPPDAATAIADVMGVTLLLAASGETFMLSSMPIWVQPVAIALSLARSESA